MLRFEYENAKQRLITQQDTIKSFSKEGARYLRLILVLIGVPIAVLGALDPTTLSSVGNLVLSDTCMFDEPPCISIKYVSIAGSIGLLTSSMANIVAGGYEAYNVRNVSNPNDLHETISSEESLSEHLKNRIQGYKSRIEYNDQLIFSLDRILMIGKLALLFTIITISMIAYRLLVGTTVSLVGLLVVSISVLLVFGTLYRILPDSISDKKPLLKFNPPYSLEYKKELNHKESGNRSSSEMENEF